MRVAIAYGRGTKEVELPTDNVVKVLEYQSTEPLASPCQAIAGTENGRTENDGKRETENGTGSTLAR